jgi:23S rRNA G2069 N7-methylase RlmK/C1962 C5-methylase RlmI
MPKILWGLGFYNPKGIFVRNDVNLRKLEGLSLENKIYIMICKYKKVLDCFCHTGVFGIYAKNYLAKDVIFVNSSRIALEMAEKNYEQNGFKNFNGLESDALEYLNSQEAKDEKFDLVNIDPPGLIKNRKDFNAGFKHYIGINARN